MEDPTKVLREAMRLPSAARAALAARLIESLDTEVEEGAEDAWSDEIAKRVSEIDDRTVATVPWSEARRRILAAVDGRPGS